jgi:outer membrane lipoprotein-sorting protein
MSSAGTKSAVEYLAPARDKGTKMLKMGDQIWMYMPVVEREQQISGHMLRQGMMGSDMSYEDLMSATNFASQYEAKVIGSEDVAGRSCYKLELTARDETVTYPRRLAWIDKEYILPVKQELYALSGMLVKTWEMLDVKSFDGGRHYPMKMVISDKVQEGTSTTMVFSDIKFGVEVADEVFSRRWLSRK